MPPVSPAMIMSGVQALGGLGQMIFSGRKKAERELNALQVPTAQGSRSISNFYNEALGRYNVSPTDSAMYRRQQQNINRGLATGLNSLRGRGSALAGAGRLFGGASDAYLNAEVAAENERNRRFSQLGQAAGMQTEDERRLFEINQMMPFQRKDRLAQMKLAAANARFDAGMSNLAGAAGNAAMLMGGGKKGGDTSLG